MNTNENFDALWNSFRDEVRKARVAEKQAIVRPAGGGEMGHYIAAGNDLALDGSQPIALSTPHSSSYIRLDAEGCRALAAQLFACSLKVDEAKNGRFDPMAHGHLLGDIDAPRNTATR